MKKKREGNYDTSCRICDSPFREEIEKAVRAHVAKSAIAEQYSDHFAAAVHNVYRSLLKHINNKHNKSLSTVITPDVTEEENLPAPINEDGTPMSVELYAQKLLELGFQPEMLKKVKHIDIFRAQKLLIEKQRVKNEENALKIGMARLMSGMIISKDVDELQELMNKKEIVDGSIVTE